MTTRDPRKDPRPGDVLLLNGSKITVLNGPTVVVAQREGFQTPEGMTLAKWLGKMTGAIVVEHAGLGGD